MITLERANYLFKYDPRTGLLTRRVTLCGRALVGAVVGTQTNEKKRGLRVGVDGRLYQVHHICWLLYYGVWPKQQIDHRDMDEQNNKIKNLREATQSQNHYNKNVYASNQLGIKGVCEDKRTGRYRAYITVEKKRIHLGFFATAAEAKLARSAAQWMHGEFARGV